MTLTRLFIWIALQNGERLGQFSLQVDWTTRFKLLVEACTKEEISVSHYDQEKRYNECEEVPPFKKRGACKTHGPPPCNCTRVRLLWFFPENLSCSVNIFYYRLLPTSPDIIFLNGLMIWRSPGRPSWWGGIPFQPLRKGMFPRRVVHFR